MSNPSWTSKLQVKKEGFSTSLDWLYYLEILSNNPIQDSLYPYGSLCRKRNVGKEEIEDQDEDNDDTDMNLYKEGTQ